MLPNPGQMLVPPISGDSKLFCIAGTENSTHMTVYEQTDYII